MRENLIERGKSFIINLSQQVENDIAAFNFSGVTAAIKDSVDKNKEIKYAILMDSTGKAIIHTQRPDLVQTELTTERDREALKQKYLKVVMNYHEDNGEVVEVINPIQISAEPWGVLRLVYTLKPLEKEINVIRTQIQREINIMIYRSVVTSLGIVGLCLIVVFILSTRITKRIYLTESARKLSKGDFSVFLDFKISSRDEVGILGKTFVEMSGKLKDTYQALEDYSKNLEDKVVERTHELEKALTDTAQARDRIDGIVKSVADGLIVTDIYNRVILMNRTAEDLLGVRLSEMIDRPIAFAIQDETLRERVRSTLQKKKEGYEFDFELPSDDPKHPRIMRARTSVIADKEGKQTGIVTIIHDVTHEREVDRPRRSPGGRGLPFPCSFSYYSPPFPLWLTSCSSGYQNSTLIRYTKPVMMAAHRMQTSTIFSAIFTGSAFLSDTSHDKIIARTLLPDGLFWTRWMGWDILNVSLLLQVQGTMDTIMFINDFLVCLIPIMVALDAPGILPLFVAMTEGVKKHERRTIARQSIITAFFVTVGFVLVGRWIFHALGILVRSVTTGS